jgi:DNA-binding NtrC family response regulator
METMHKLIFIIDDDPVYSKFLEGHFELLDGYTVKLFSTGTEAVQNLYQRPNLILLDHDLNEHSYGFDYLSRIRVIDSTIPIIYMSSEASDELAARSKMQGAYGFIPKDAAFLVRLRAMLDTLSNYKPKKSMGFLLQRYLNKDLYTKT